LLAFGEKGLALAVVFFTAAATLHFTLGVVISSGSLTLREFLRSPINYALLASFLFIFFGESPPAFIASTTKLLAGMTVPIMLITLGISLSKLQVSGLKRGTIFSVVRLVMGFGVGIGIATAFQLEGMAWGVTVVESAMPVAVFNYLFALRYNNAPEEVAGMVVVSTLMSFSPLPFLMWFVIG